MVPAELVSQYRLLEPSFVVMRDYVQARLQAELSELSPVAVLPRIKGIQSAYDKLQTGRYRTLLGLSDLVGIKIVMLRKSQVRQAIQIASSVLEVVEEPTRLIQPTDFSYAEPHLIVRPTPDFCDRHPELRAFGVELQFTTALQHALDMATHDFDYKGKSFSWGNFRIVAQLRGSLELVDNLIDGAETMEQLARENAAVPPEFQRRQDLLGVLLDSFSEDKLPHDLRRMATIIDGWLEACGVSGSDLGDGLVRHKDLVEYVSLNPVDAVLGVLLREHGALLISNTSKNFCVSEELKTLCEEIRFIPEERRTDLANREDVVVPE